MITQREIIIKDQKTELEKVKAGSPEMGAMPTGKIVK
jgi:hypothetical protein